jgi:glycosyltransferase involved in cell wall biosynthesis
MSSGCCVVAYRATAIEEAIEHGVDGFLVDSPEQMNAMAKRLLANPAYCEAIGNKAREKALGRHNLDVFVDKWNQILRLAVNAPWWRKQW